MGRRVWTSRRQQLVSVSNEGKKTVKALVDFLGYKYGWQRVFLPDILKSANVLWGIYHVFDLLDVPDHQRTQ